MNMPSQTGKNEVDAGVRRVRGAVESDRRRSRHPDSAEDRGLERPAPRENQDGQA